MNNSLAKITALITGQLSPLLGVEVSHIELAPQEADSLGTVTRVSAFDQDKREHSLVLKKQDNDVAYRLYQQYLDPYHLNSPKEYGYIALDGQLFLVMDYIKHVPTRWEDRASHLKAVHWLIKKDLISQQNMDFVRGLDCLGVMPYYGMDYWLPDLEKWYQASRGNRQAEEVWACVTANRNRLNEYIDQIKEEGVQTVVHGDLSVDNILFVEHDTGDELFVIDWTQPHIGSVTEDLVSLYDGAPDHVKSEIVRTYREHIDFYQFDEIFAKAKVLRDLGYLSWMVWIIVDQKGEIDPKELDRVATNLLLSLSDG